MERAFKGVWIPKEIWLSKELTLTEKVFLTEIESLDNSDGCFASNEHFATFFNLSKNRCSEIVKSLEKKGYVDIKYIYKENSKEILKRIIRIKNRTICYKSTPSENRLTPSENRLTPSENCEENNTSINNTNNNISKDILSSNKLLPIIEAWNKLNLSKLVAIKPNTNRYKMLKTRINEFGIEKVIEAIESINNSDFLKGQNDRSWVITFDWLIKPNNFTKVLEGNYLNKGGNINGQYSNGKFNNRWSSGKSEKSFNVKTNYEFEELSDEDRRKAEELI
ncbi:MAG: helix-turn-helix domain-containing protein [Clostridium saudiense]|uniref:helix-turn-helix domain-containing protein n=1 Tax=Clostridium saudiense TaxID=1414720 RepID=UPI002E9E5544|nr:helix-turn-helix domain-containing protein [Clostridium saudiense]